MRRKHCRSSKGREVGSRHLLEAGKGRLEDPGLNKDPGGPATLRFEVAQANLRAILDSASASASTPNHQGTGTVLPPRHPDNPPRILPGPRPIHECLSPSPPFSNSSECQNHLQAIKRRAGSHISRASDLIRAEEA